MDEKYLDLARDLLERDKNLRAVQAAMDRMSQLEYDLPPALQALQWVRLVKTSGPFDAIRGATRALAYKNESVDIEPISVSKKERDPNSLPARTLANTWERCLKWQMDKATQRTTTIRSDVIRSAVLYDEVVGQIIHLPTQRKQAKNFEKNAKRNQMMGRLGDFAIDLKHPSCVHTLRSVWGVEAVLCVEKRTSDEIEEIWGDQSLDEKIDCWVLFDYSDYERRVVWCVPGESEDVAATTNPDSANLHTILDEPMKYPFLPWVAVIGGTNLNAEPAEQRLPLLYPIYKTEQWVASNISNTLLMAQAIAKAAQPDAKVTGPDPDSVDLDYTQPGQPVHVPPGHDYVTLQKAGLDPALREMGAMLETSISTSTLSRVLITAEAMTGESYSGYQLRVNTAVGSLLPYKSVGEKFLVEAYRTMLLWCHYAHSDITGYGTEKGDRGQTYTIKAEDIDPDNIYLDVELKVDVPSERLQQINGANMLMQMGMPFEVLAGELGITDPEYMKAEKAREMLWNAAMQGKAEKVKAIMSGQYQQDIMTAAQQMHEQMMAMQQEQAQSQMQAPEFGPPDLAALSGMEEAGGLGQGFAPPMGGTPPIQGMGDAATFEGATGQTRGMV